MSDDEELIYKKPQNTIHYGSLEEGERLRQNLEDIQSDEEEEYEPEVKKPAPSTTAVGIPPSSSQAGNINISSEYFDLEQEMYDWNRSICMRSLFELELIWFEFVIFPQIQRQDSTVRRIRATTQG